jgi:sporulation integral membrane protein YtvI
MIRIAYAKAYERRAAMNRFLLYLKIVINFVIVIFGALLLIFVLPALLRFFMPFAIGWIIALIANPLVQFLEKRVKIHRKHSSAIILILVISAIVAITVLIISLLVKEVRSLMDDMPVIIESVKLQFDELTQAILRFSKTLPANIQTMINNLIEGVGNYASNLSQQIEPLTMRKAGNFVQNIAEGFLGLIVIILSAYFFAAGRNDINSKLKKNIPDSITSYWHLIFDNFKAAFGGYFKAQFKIMFVVTIIMFIGFEILKVGYSFLFALGIAFLDVLPVFGTGAVLWPWAIIDVLTGNYIRAIGLVTIYLICQVLKQILQPKMVGDSIGLNPLATLFFMFVGYRIYGVFGMIIGIPVGMVLVKLYRIGLFDRTIKGFKIIAKDLNEFRKF